MCSRGTVRLDRAPSRLCAFVSLCLILVTVLLLAPTIAIAQTYAPPRARDGHPSLQGIWQVRNTANWDVQHHAGSYKIPAGLGVVVDPPDGIIPYQPYALEKKKQNFENRAT